MGRWFSWSACHTAWRLKVQSLAPNKGQMYWHMSATQALWGEKNGDRQVSEVCWPGSETPCLKKLRWKATEENIQHLPLVSTHEHTTHTSTTKNDKETYKLDIVSTPLFFPHLESWFNRIIMSFRPIWTTEWHPNLQNKNWGWRDSSEVKSTGCSFRSPEFNS